MYVHRRVYCKQWEYQKPEERFSVQIARGGKPVSGIDLTRISSVDEEVMCWRKANQIHKWFVDNVQCGKDDCGEYLVDDDQICELLEVCEKVIKASKLVDGMVYSYRQWDREKQAYVTHREPGQLIEDPTTAQELLPAMEGFFFGHYEYDEWYLDGVIATRDWAKRMLAEDKRTMMLGEIYYSSSW